MKTTSLKENEVEEVQKQILKDIGDSYNLMEKILTYIR